MKTHLDVFYLGSVREAGGWPDDEIEIQPGINVGELLRFPPEEHNASFDSSFRKERKKHRPMMFRSGSCDRDILQIGGKNERQE